MRKIISILIIVVFAFVCLVAFVQPVRDFMYNAMGPSLQGFFGDVGASIGNSPIWQNWITPFPNQLIIGMIIMIPIAIFIHNSFNRVRAVFVRSAMKESGQPQVMVEPVSSVSTNPTPTPTTPTDATKPPETKKSEKA